MGCAQFAGEWPAGPAVLVGREQEIRRMVDLLDGVAPGRPSVLVVEGRPGSGRTRLVNELAAVARRRGVTVVTEKDWAGSAAVLVALTGRAGSDPRDLPAGTHRIRLGPLPDAEVERFLTLMLAGPPGPELLDLSRVAAGRPGALQELITGLREEGLLTVDGGRIRLRVVRLPARTRSWLRAELAALSPPARHLVQAATTLPAPFPLHRLTGLLQVSPVMLLPAINEVLESGLFRDDELVRFSHELVRPVVQTSMPRSVVAALRKEPPAPAQRRTTSAVTVSRAPRILPPLDWSLLTAREQEIAGYVGGALTNRQIAHRIGRSPHTVNFHLRQIFHKLGLSSRVELASLVRQRETSSGPSSS